MKNYEITKVVYLIVLLLHLYIFLQVWSFILVTINERQTCEFI